MVNGGNKLYGDIFINGMKNAALPIIFATIVVNDKCTIENLPSVSDVTLSLDILKMMGASVKFIDKTTVEIDTRHFIAGSSPLDLVGKMRASYYLLGAELGRVHKAKVGWPGGCYFGNRPIDQHKKGFQALGAVVNEAENGYITVSAENGLHGNSVYFDVASVGATINVMLAAVLADGMTVIENAAKEPHIVDLANFFNTCGANIVGAGTSVIKIRGVKKLSGCSYTIIPDMIEAGTYMTAIALTGGKVNIRNIIPKHVESVTAKLLEMGVEVEEYDDYITVTSNRKLKAANIKTLPYPGFPTDMHPQFSAILALADGVSIVSEGIWENRFRYVEELLKMGANITVEGKTATIIGVPKLSGAPVKAVDLRAGAAMIVAGLAAEGRTEISGIESIERGYYNIVGNLRAIGADIKKIYSPDTEQLSEAN